MMKDENLWFDIPIVPGSHTFEFQYMGLGITPDVIPEVIPEVGGRMFLPKSHFRAPSLQAAGQLRPPDMSARALLKQQFKLINKLPTRCFSSTRPTNADFTHAV